MRRLPLSGLAFVGCFAVSVALYGSGARSDPAGIVAYYSSSTDRLRQIAGFAVLLVGCVFLLVYVVVLTRDVVSEEPLATVALLSGCAGTLLLAAGNALWASSAFTAQLEPDYRMSPQAHLLIEDAAFAVIVSGMALAIPCVAVTSLAAARSRRLPRWFALLGAVAVVGLAAAYWYWPLAAFLAWIACGSVLVARPSYGRDPTPQAG